MNDGSLIRTPHSFDKLMMVSTVEPSSLRTEMKEVSMIRLSYRTSTFTTVVYGIAVTISWVLTTVYYLLSASH